MNLVVNQHIVIHQLKVNSVNNSSILQIGSAGIMKPLSNLYNTGGFKGPAPELGGASSLALVPLPNPT